jgi:hypothetical protein
VIGEENNNKAVVYPLSSPSQLLPGLSVSQARLSGIHCVSLLSSDGNRKQKGREKQQKPGMIKMIEKTRKINPSNMRPPFST